MTSTPVIVVERVSHTYERWGHRVRALKDLNLTIPRGEWVTIVGPNGSGKSTLLGLIAGQLMVQAGQVRVAGKDISTVRRRDLARAVFLVHQDPTTGTAPTLTVLEHLMLADGYSGNRRSYPRHAEELLAAVRLDVPLHQPVSALSGGQRQLLVLLLARLRPALIVLLDEPLAALDPERAQLCDCALDLLRLDGKTLVLVTHDIDYALARGDRTIVLVGGELAMDERGASRTKERIGIVWEPLRESLRTAGAGR